MIVVTDMCYNRTAKHAKVGGGLINPKIQGGVGRGLMSPL